MTLIEYVEAWRIRVMRPNPAFGTLPACPYAHTAVRIGCFVALTPEEGEKMLACFSRLGIRGRELDIIEWPKIHRERLHESVNGLMPVFKENDIEVLISDCDKPFIIDGYRTTQEEKLLVILQCHSELERLRARLRRSAYYDNWTPEQLALMY